MSKDKKIRSLSLTISILLHLVILVSLAVVKVAVEAEKTEFVEIGFGKLAALSNPGGEGNAVEDVKNNKKNTKKDTKEDKKVESPETRNTSRDNQSTSQKENNESSENVRNRGNRTQGSGGFGFDIDWGGRGSRRILSKVLPAYPDGVQKEAPVTLRFIILPDGTIGSIVPVTKADSRLESASVSALKLWRFEKLPEGETVNQTAQIVFNFRLE